MDDLLKVLGATGVQAAQHELRAVILIAAAGVC